MDDGMESGGLDSTSGSEGEGESVSVSEGNAEVEISEESNDNLGSSIGEKNADQTEKSVSITENISKSVSVSDSPKHEEWDVSDIVSKKGTDGMIENINAFTKEIEKSDAPEDIKTAEIRTRVNETMKNIGRSNLSPEEKVEAMHTVLDKIPDRAKTDICIPGHASFLNSEIPFKESGLPAYQWEGNMGFEGKPEQCKLEVGTVVDRYGSASGTFVCEVKNGVPQEYDSRALPYKENAAMYHQYEVTKDLDGFKAQIDSLTVEDIEKIEAQREMVKPESERRTPEQIKEDASTRYAAIMLDVRSTAGNMRDAANENGWQKEYEKSELAPMKGKIKESFSYVDQNGKYHKKGGGEQICLPARVETLVYLGYMKEK